MVEADCATYNKSAVGGSNCVSVGHGQDTRFAGHTNDVLQPLGSPTLDLPTAVGNEYLGYRVDIQDGYGVDGGTRGPPGRQRTSSIGAAMTAFPFLRTRNPVPGVYNASSPDLRHGDWE